MALCQNPAPVARPSVVIAAAGRDAPSWRAITNAPVHAIAAVSAEKRLMRNASVPTGSQPNR